MHHQDFSGDSPGAGSRRTAFHFRRGSSGASASGSGASAADDSHTQTGSSSPSLHHQPQSQVSGAQVKKKSGFQITSVTSAQINVSGNNSLADDTESYDDLDESHTEDLSSSDMLDVSVSRATDTGVPERSSSDDTLNSLHGVDTPGIVSPNEPLHPHSTPQVSQHTSMVNGTMHHHHYYPQQHIQSHHHHSDSVEGEPPLSALPIAPLASSSPALASKSGASRSQRTPMLDNTTGGTTQPLGHIVGVVATDATLQGSVNVSNATIVAGAAAPPAGSAGFENTSVSGQVASGGGGTGPSVQAQHPQTHAATGSRFRVVKLDTNSEPFRKGRWTCAEFYEKEIPPPTTSDAPKGAELAVESEAGSAVIGPNVPAVHPPHTLQPYQHPTLDFTSPQAIQSPPQGLTYVSPQEVVSGAHIPKPPVTLPTATPQAGGSQPVPGISQQFSYPVDPHSGVMNPGSVRQPDFIQPTAPFQTQVQPPPLHLTTGISVVPVTGAMVHPQVSITQLSQQGQGTPTAPTSFAAGQPQTLQSHPLPHQQPQAQPPSTATVPVAPTHGITYMPLTALKADLQPLLTPGTTLTQVPSKSSQLEDAQKLLLQHQGLLALPRLAGAVGGVGTSEITGGTLAHMGMSAEASAFMAAAAAGLRSQHAEGEDDSSSGASVVAIDNKIEQAMDLVKSHLMYAVREEVEVLKEQIKELIERNTQLEQENNLLKNLASPEQMAQFQAQVQTSDSPTGSGQPPVLLPTGSTQVLPSMHIPSSSA